jgi:hypothetical protein
MDDPKPAPSFGKVFSTTGKVILALVLISVGIGAVFGLIALLRNSNTRPSVDSSSFIDYQNKVGDEKRTTMPLSKWNKAMAAAIKQHCPAVGMNKEEAEKAVGKPPDASQNTWVFERDIEKECIKYDGEKCAEHKKDHQISIVYFSPNGHIRSPNAELSGWLYSNCFNEPFYSSYYSHWND